MIKQKHNMPAIAFVHNRFPAGGAERITQDIAEYLKVADGSYQVYVYASEFLCDSADDLIIRRQIPGKGKHRAKEVERLIKQDGIEVLVQVTAPIQNIVHIRERTGCKAVLANHGEPFWQRYTIINRRKKGILKRILWKLFNEKRYIEGGLAMKMAIARSKKQYLECDAYTVLCEGYRVQTAEAFGIDVGASHIYAIENPEKLVQDLHMDKEKILMFCGRLEQWSKRIDRLLRIWKKVQDKLPDWKLIIVGDGPDRGMLENMAKSEGLERAHFVGAQADVISFYKKASIVALTSNTEGWPLALSEAQANGCIPIAFGCTEGIRELLSPEDGTCGFLVTPFDEEEYAETLLRIAGMTEEEQRQIRTCAVARRSRYAPELIAEKWKVLFDRLTNR